MCIACSGSGQAKVHRLPSYRFANDLLNLNESNALHKEKINEGLRGIGGFGTLYGSSESKGRTRLPLEHRFGSRGRIRTAGQAINSRWKTARKSAECKQLSAVNLHNLEMIMENFDLFNHYTPSTNESHTSSTNVDTKMADTPPEKPTPNRTRVTTDEAVVDCSRSNILVFAHQYQRDMWTSFKHRRDCMMQVGRFAQYKDFGIRPMSDLKTRDFIQYRDYLLSTGLKKGMVNRHLSALSACFQFAVETVGLLTDRPRVLLYKEDKPNTRAFTKEMVQDLIAHFEADGDKWMADMVRLGCMTGMRQSEIVALPLSIVEFDSSTKEVWLPPEVTKTNTGRMVSLQAGNAWDVAMRLRDTIGREFTHGRFYSR